MDRYRGFEEFVLARTAALSRTAYMLTGDHHLAEDHLSPALLPQELGATTVLPGDVTLTAGGRMLVRTKVKFGDLVAPADILVVNLETTRFERRYVLPGPIMSAGHLESWQVLRELPQGLLLQHRSNDRVLDLQLYVPATGERYLVSDLSALPGK